VKLAVAVVMGLALLGGCGDASPNKTQPVRPSAATPTPTAALPDLCPPKGDPAAAGRKALPDLTLQCLGSDAQRDLRRLAGRPTVINFWASWCGPCKVELPLLARAHGEWGDQVAFLGIDVQDASAQAWKSLTVAGVDYPQLEDPDGSTRAPFGWHSGLPLTVFVDARGRMVGTERTAFRTYPEVTAALRRHLGALLEAQEPGRRVDP
jgi:cytochrome c biogenesis protein CcmG, thiol:disulfide interchange protein DsbE